MLSQFAAFHFYTSFVITHHALNVLTILEPLFSSFAFSRLFRDMELHARSKAANGPPLSATVAYLPSQPMVSLSSPCAAAQFVPRATPAFSPFPGHAPVLQTPPGPLPSPPPFLHLPPHILHVQLNMDLTKQPPRYNLSRSPQQNQEYHRFPSRCQLNMRKDVRLLHHPDYR